MTAADRPPALSEADLEPLLQATASRALDTCLRGARGLAVLGDPRAFGMLLQLSREEDTPARVEVCRALAALDDPRSLKRLRSLTAFLASSDILYVDFDLLDQPADDAHDGEYVARYGVAPRLVNYLFYAQPATVAVVAGRLHLVGL